jgi:predicted Fe-Mo cluster-binding NifX family protein
MQAAFSCWQRRIAPVFDTACQVHLVEVISGQVTRTRELVLPDGLPVRRVLHLVELGTGTLVCGAVSRPLHELITAYGIMVIPFVAGDLDDVVQAWLAGGRQLGAFAMPGCRGRGRGRRRRARSGPRQGKVRTCQAEIEQDPRDRDR